MWPPFGVAFLSAASSLASIFFQKDRATMAIAVPTVPSAMAISAMMVAQSVEAERLASIDQGAPRNEAEPNAYTWPCAVVIQYPEFACPANPVMESPGTSAEVPFGPALLRPL